MYYILFLETFSSFDFRTPISPLPSYSKTSCWVFAVPPSSRHSKYQRAPRLSPQLSSLLYSTDFLGYLTRCHIFQEHLHTDYSHTYTSGLDLSHELQVHVSHCLLNIYTWSLTGISASRESQKRLTPLPLVPTLLLSTHVFLSPFFFIHAGNLDFTHDSSASPTSDIQSNSQSLSQYIQKLTLSQHLYSQNLSPSHSHLSLRILEQWVSSLLFF